jgi:hypothetical protein
MHDGEQVRKMNEVNSLYDGAYPSESGIMLRANRPIHRA